MASRRDALVVGGGISGTAVAYWFAERDMDVTLLEQSSLASGPTAQSSAVVRQHYRHDDPRSLLAARGLAFFTAMSDLTDGEVAFVPCGALYVTGDEDGERFAENVVLLRERGTAIEALRPQDIAELVPSARLDGIALGVWDPTAGYTDPVGATKGLAAAAARRGARIETHCRVDRLLVKGTSIEGVQLASGETYLANAVVVAAGPWSRSLLGQIGVDLPLTTERHPVAVLRLSDGANADTVVPCIWSDLMLGFYTRPEGESAIIVAARGASPLFDGVALANSSVEASEAADLVRLAAPRFPEFSHLQLIGGRAGLYDVSPDWLPFVGLVPGFENLYCICGTSGDGFKFAPSIGEELVRLVCEGKSDYLATFALGRRLPESRLLEATW